MSDRDDYRKIFWIGLAVMLILIGISAVIGVLYKTQTFMPSYMNSAMNWGWGLIGLFMGIIWILFIVWIISWFFQPLRHSYRYYFRDIWNHDDAVEILRERYAKGEITKEQFDQMLADLEIARKK